ncbi:NAD-dependent epimerase/dehydratase family protein [Nocardia transvalensis]|uniref:NAD-dependent epimerase/dehydratase family protein n=1 Tax=Nocardia transvalensis TaxID=37333 RepID=UPI001893F843|nr:NAD-dependent epimerase/dehydratase family protein [Nocardia transvalensis]MBF6333499.1 NAD-dependent epimerase/dehydratase family protein [Nocardia transvalensis]
MTSVLHGPRPPDAAALDGSGHRALEGLRVLVTGGAGHIGGHTVARLKLAGAHVHVLDDMSTGRSENLTAALSVGLSKQDVSVCDIRDPRCVRTIMSWRPQVVVHLAAHTSIPDSKNSPATDADVNIRGSLKVFEACRAAGVQRVVFAASAAIYGQVRPNRLPVTEYDPIRPVSPYGLSKATGLHYLEWFHQEHGLSYTGLAIGNVYGPEQRNGGVIARLADAVVHGRPALIFGDGHQTRDFVHVADVARAIVAACTSPADGLINIGSGLETSIHEVFDLLCQAAGVQTTPQFEPAVAGETRRMVLDIQCARDLLGWRPHVLLDQGIADMVHELRRRRPEVA